jgi:hypothetical protein
VKWGIEGSGVIREGVRSGKKMGESGWRSCDEIR